MAALLPCPHCGESRRTLKLLTAQELAEQDSNYDGEFWEHSESWAVICNTSRPDGPGGCGASGGFFPTAREAVEAWNRRASPATQELPPVQVPPLPVKFEWIGACNCRGPDGPCADCESRQQARDEWFDEPVISPREAEAYARAAIALDRQLCAQARG